MTDKETKFWSAIISPDHQYNLTVPEDKILLITNASLAEYPESAMGQPNRVYSYSNTDENEKIDIYIAILVAGKTEHSTFSFKLAPGQETTLGVYGACPVHLCGHYIPINDDDYYESGEDEEEKSGDAPAIPAVENPQ